MRKPILILAVVALFPVALFAQVAYDPDTDSVGNIAIGGAAYFKSPVLLGQSIDTDNLNVNQFSVGGDLRVKISWFQAEGLLLYSAGKVNSLGLYLDAGVALDVAIVRLSAGFGPKFSYNFDEDTPVQAGLNAKLGGDVMFGPFSVGLSYIMVLNIDNDVYVTTGSGLLGAQILFWR